MDDAMSPTVKPGDLCTVALIASCLTRNPDYDYTLHHNKLICMIYGTFHDGGELFIRRMRKGAKKGDFDIIPDNPIWKTYPFIEDGIQGQFHLVGEVRAILTIIPTA